MILGKRLIHIKRIKVIEGLIERDKNHACVVMWSIANEPASNEKGAKAYFEPFVELAKRKDPRNDLLQSLPF